MLYPKPSVFMAYTIKIVVSLLEEFRKWRSLKLFVATSNLFVTPKPPVFCLLLYCKFKIYCPSNILRQGRGELFQILAGTLKVLRPLLSKYKLQSRANYFRFMILSLYISRPKQRNDNLQCSYLRVYIVIREGE